MRKAIRNWLVGLIKEALAPHVVPTLKDTGGLKQQARKYPGAIHIGIECSGKSLRECMPTRSSEGACFLINHIHAAEMSDGQRFPEFDGYRLLFHSLFRPSAAVIFYPNGDTTDICGITVPRT